MSTHRSVSRSRRGCASTLAPLLVIACSDGPVRVDEPITCDARGGTAAGTQQVWTRAGSPYRLSGRVVMAELRIEPGTLICATGGAELVVGVLRVDGTEESSVEFLPTASGVRWAGIRHEPTAGASDVASHMRHTRIMGARQALSWAQSQIGNVGTINLDSVRIERVDGSAISGAGSWRGVTVERACSAPAVPGDSTAWQTQACAAVVVAGGASVHDITIRDSGGDGIAVNRRSWLIIGGGRLENGAGTGIRTMFEDVHGGTVVFADAVTITGYARALEVPFNALAGVLSTEAGIALLRGNASDTVHAFSGTTWSAPAAAEGPPILRNGLPVRVNLPCLTGFVIAVLMPGAHLEFTGDVCERPAGTASLVRLTVAGTASQPTSITGSGHVLGLGAADTIRFRHARIRNVLLSVRHQAAVLEHVTLERATLDLRAPGSRLSDAAIREGGRSTAGGASLAALTLGEGARVERTAIENAVGDGVHIVGDNVNIADCNVRGSTGHGIHVLLGSGTRVNGCAFVLNGGSGVHNATAGSVDARDSWWGDPLGPFGPAGDGVSGPVDFIPFRLAPPDGRATARPRR